MKNALYITAIIAIITLEALNFSGYLIPVIDHIADVVAPRSKIICVDGFCTAPAPKPVYAPDH